MKPLDYLQLQLRLEGKAILQNNLMRQVEVVPDEEMPLMVIASLANQELVACDAEKFRPVRTRLPGSESGSLQARPALS